MLKQVIRKIVGKKKRKLYNFKEFRKKVNGKIGYYSNSKEATDIIETAIKNKIILENELIIYKKQNIPINSKNVKELDDFEEKDVDIIFCFSSGEIDSSIDELYKKIQKQNMIIHDGFAFMGETPKKYPYRNIEYQLDENTVIPTHYANDQYINRINDLLSQYQNKINLLDICAGQGSIGFSIFNESKKIKKLFSVDINPHEVIQMLKTRKINNLPDTIEIINSDVLESVNLDEKIDLVVSNPPHQDRKTKNINDLQGGDTGWTFHKKFFNSITKYMADSGIITLIENSDHANPELFTKIISNELEIYNVEFIQNTPWFILFIKKKNSTPFIEINK